MNRLSESRCGCSEVEPMPMIQTMYGELPVIGTLKRCVATERLAWRFARARRCVRDR
jgi:hypothetical protein